MEILQQDSQVIATKFPVSVLSNLMIRILGKRSSYLSDTNRGNYAQVNSVLLF